MAAGLNQSANEVVQASRGTTQDLARATSKFGQDFSNFVEAGVDMAGTSQVSMIKEYLAEVMLAVARGETASKKFICNFPHTTDRLSKGGNLFDWIK